MKLKERVIKEIKEGKNEYFCYGHFDKSNMADYTLMSCAIKDLMEVYGFNEFEAADIVTVLTH